MTHTATTPQRIAGINKANPGRWVLTDGVVYIAPQELSGIAMTDDAAKAEVWSYADTVSSKGAYFRQVTGLDLIWIKLTA
jgi:hypothetical protein